MLSLSKHEGRQAVPSPRRPAAARGTVVICQEQPAATPAWEAFR